MAKTNRSSTAIRYHDHELAWHRLPFKRLTNDESGHWGLPAVGGYTNGGEAGAVAAIAYMKYLAEHPDESRDGLLQHIVLAMASRIKRAKSGSEEAATLQGHVVGFFQELDAWLRDAAKAHSDHLSALTETEICTKLQDAIDGGGDRMLAEVYAAAMKGRGSKRGSNPDARLSAR